MFDLIDKFRSGTLSKKASLEPHVKRAQKNTTDAHNIEFTHSYRHAPS